MRVIGNVVVLLFAIVLSGCAGSVSSPDVVRALPPDQIATLHLKDIQAKAGQGVVMNLTDLTRITAAVKTEVTYAAPGIIVDPSSPGAASALTMELVFTRYDAGNAFARFMLIGLGQIHIDADVQLIDSGNVIKGQYQVSKDFAMGGVAGGSTRIEDVEVGFAKSVAEIVKKK